MAHPNALLARSINRRDFLKVAGGSSLAGAALLAGCGGSTGSGGSKITLNHWHQNPGDPGSTAALYRYAKQYEALNPNVKINTTVIPSDYATKLSTALLSPNAPDIFELGPGPTYAQVKAGLIAPVDDLYTPAVKAAFHPQDLEQLTMNGHIYGVKTLEDFAVMYYRKSMFAKANVGIPSTIDELIETAKILTKGNVKGLFMGNSGGARGYVYSVQAPWAAGTQFIDNNQQIGINTPKMATVLSKFHEMDTSGSLLDGAPTDCFDPGAFNNGLCAIQWCGMWAMPPILKQWGDDVDVFPFPSLDATTQPGVWYAGWSNCISAKSQNIAEAKKYLQWFAIQNTQVQLDWNTSYTSLHVPPVLSVAAQANNLKSGIALKAVGLLQQYGQVTSPLWDNTMATALSTVITNVEHGKDPASELNTAYQACVKELHQEVG